MSYELLGKQITTLHISFTKFGDIPINYLNGGQGHILSKIYIPYRPTIVKKPVYNILMDLFGADIELDAEELRLRYEMASYNLRRFLQLTGM
jgi:hypothetical protein